MSSKRLLVMRHGETLFNWKGWMQGACDSPLTAKGVEQAKESGEWIKTHYPGIDHFYSSPSMRCQDTLRHALGWQCDYQLVDGLREVNFGALEAMPSPFRGMSQFVDSISDILRSETHDAAGERVEQTILNLMDRDDHHTVMVASHGACLFAFMKRWIPQDQMFFLGNAGVVVLDYDDEHKTFTLRDSWNPYLRKLNVPDYRPKTPKA